MTNAGAENFQSDYGEYLDERTLWIDRKKNSTTRFVAIKDRTDDSCLTQEQLQKLEKAKYMKDWRGVPMSKDALDCDIYETMLWEIKPRTVIELGTMMGGSILWLADHVHMFGLACQVIGFDRDFTRLHEKARLREGVTYLQGDSNEIEKTFTPQMLQELPHPWIIIEDAHANLKRVLEHFNRYMISGDYFAVEDGHPAICVNPINTIRSEDDEIWGFHKMNIIRSFLEENTPSLMVDTYYTDRFGFNGTFNMNGFIRKM